MRLPAVFWMVRELDLHTGLLSDEVLLFDMRPERALAQWFPHIESMDKYESYLGSWTVDEARKRTGTVPETDVECIRVGRSFEENCN